MSVTIYTGYDPVSNVPAAVVASTDGCSFTVTSWSPQSTVASASTVQLYIRKWDNGTAAPLLHSGWDGVNEVKLNQAIGQFAYGNPGAQWPIQNPPGPEPAAKFLLNSTQQWSIIPQLGAVSNAMPSSPDFNVLGAPSSAQPITLVNGANQITLQGVANGSPDGGNIIVTVDVTTLTR